MSNALKDDWRLSPEEYLAREAEEPCKHEYLDGRMYAVPSLTNRHNTICTNISSALYVGLKGKEGRLFNSNTKVRIRRSADTRFYYPDAMVVCRQNSLDEHFQDEPVVIVEVTSSSSRRVDHVEKADAYRSIASAMAYVIVESERVGLMVRQRVESVEARGAQVPFRHVGVADYRLPHWA